MKSELFPWRTSIAQRVAFAFLLGLAFFLVKTPFFALSAPTLVLAIGVMLRGSGVRLSKRRQKSSPPQE
jgi:hypothetical protein